MKIPWLIRIHHRMRTASFALMFLATSLHIAGQGYGPVAWALLGLLFLVYPQLQFWRACRAANPLAAEMHNLVVDDALLGLYAGALGFPLWLSFSATIASLFNNAANKGWRGVAVGIPALLVGALLGAAAAGFPLAPDTDLPTTLFCILGLAGYLLAIGNIAYSRNRQLRLTREALRQRGSELLEANKTLAKNFQDIDELHQQLREQAIRDPLTGLYNRRYLDNTLERELAHCQREGKALSLIMIDVDHFKKYNDCYGHQAGDNCLRNVADALQACAKRASDLVARYGGEEFTLVLADTNCADAQRVAESVRLSIEALAMPHEQSDSGRVTVSVGVAVMTEHSYREVENLLRAADLALYRAKQSGRNQVQLAPETGQRPAAEEDDHLVELVWHRTYECGQALIDAEHKALFGDANRLLAAVLSARPAGAVAPLIDTLMRDIVEHFRDEETIIAAAGFPGAAEHATIHRELTDRAGELAGRFQAGTLDIGELFQFLARDVVALHMLGADREFIPFLDARHPTTAGAPARKPQRTEECAIAP